MKPIVTLVLIADDHEARLLVNEGVGKGLSQLAQHSAAELDADRFAYSDERGRATAAPGMARHAMEPRSSPERQAREAFAAHVVAALRQVWQAGGHDRIVLAAAPRMLGALRAELGDLAAHVAASLDKDLVRVPLSDLPRHFAGVAAF